jgi:RimJ/RimL family protein N-acetyltransferase
VQAEIEWMWPSEEHFYRHGFGTLALLHGQIVCWCTAEYVGPTRCGIGITTIQAYERRGVATATAAAFVHAAQQRGLTACWECNSANRGSIRVAEKVGFVCQAEESYWTSSFASSDRAVQ